MPRPRGSPNKATAASRDAFAALLDGRIDDIGAWIDRVAETDPHKAFGMVMDLARYCVPRPKMVDASSDASLPTIVVGHPDGTADVITNGASHRVRFIDP